MTPAATGIPPCPSSTPHDHSPRRGLSRIVRPDHARPRRPDPPRAHLCRPRGGRRRRQHGETAALHARRAGGAHQASRLRPERRRALVRGTARRLRPCGGSRRDRARPARGERLRVRVPDGSDEPQPGPRDRDRVPGARVRSHVPLVEPGARSGAVRRQRRAAGPPPRPPGAGAEVRPVSFRDAAYQRARRAGKRIVLPEGDDPRVQEAARRLDREGLGVVEVLGRPLPASPIPDLIRHLRSRRPDRFPDDAAARAALDHPLTYGACLVGAGLADVMVGGATFPSGDTIRAALWGVGTAPGIATVSGAFYMVRGETVLTFTDCAVVPEPTPEQLADAACAAARDRRLIAGDEPVIALLSYSTRGSAAGARVERVRQAVAILRGRHPDFPFDGELQGDAALVREVALRKAPDSPAAGRANVLVFPDLDSGNIAYQLVHRLRGGGGIGAHPPGPGAPPPRPLARGQARAVC